MVSKRSESGGGGVHDAVFQSVGTDFDGLKELGVAKRSRLFLSHMNGIDGDDTRAWGRVFMCGVGVNICKHLLSARTILQPLLSRGDATMVWLGRRQPTKKETPRCSKFFIYKT